VHSWVKANNEQWKKIPKYEIVEAMAAELAEAGAGHVEERWILE
jgi:hypothetical protein